MLNKIPFRLLNMSETIGSRIKRKREEAGLSQERLATAVGRTKGTVSQWESDSTRPKGDTLFKLADVLGCEARWLQDGSSNVVRADQPSRYFSYPVISCVQAGDWAEAVAPYEPGDEPHKEGTDYRAQGPAFWLEVKGDSMTAPHGASPSITEGTLVLFDTGLEALPGKLVVAQLEGAGEATFKQLIEDGGQRYLKALNPAYPLIPVNGNCRILGVAVETKMRL